MKIAWLSLYLFFTSGLAMASDIEDTLTNYMAAWNTHDTKKVLSFFAPSISWYDLPSDSTTHGKDKVGPAILDAFLSQVDEMYWVRSGDVWRSSNTIIYQWTYGGIYRGNWGEIKVNNKRFSIKGISTTTINDQGKITAQKDYYDLTSLARQLGVLQ